MVFQWGGYLEVFYVSLNETLYYRSVYCIRKLQDHDRVVNLYLQLIHKTQYFKRVFLTIMITYFVNFLHLYVPCVNTGNSRTHDWIYTTELHLYRRSECQGSRMSHRHHQLTVSPFACFFRCFTPVV
jgi:hypothetical protein